MKMVSESEGKDPKTCLFKWNSTARQAIDMLFSAIGWELVTNVCDYVTEGELADYACQHMRSNIHEEVLRKMAKKEGHKA